MADRHATRVYNPENPYVSAVAITPHDSTNITDTTDAIYVGVAGDITCIVDGAAVLFKAVPVGVLKIRTTRVNATGTTATTMLALYQT